MASVFPFAKPAAEPATSTTEQAAKPAAKVKPSTSTFFGYNQARTISNISAHGSSITTFCEKNTFLSNLMCSIIEIFVHVYSTIKFQGCLSFTHESAMLSSSRFGGVIVFMTAFIEIIIEYQTTPDLWKEICELGKFLIFANTGANRVTLGRGKEIHAVNKEKNAAFLKENELPQPPLSSINFERNQKIDDLGEHLPAPMEIFTFERSHSKELLINVRRIYDILKYPGPQSISNLKKVQQDFNSLYKTDREIMNSAGNGGFSGVHLSICQYCKQDGEILTAVFTTPFDVTDLFNYQSLCNGYVQYNTTKAGGEKTGWITINSTEARKSKIKQAKTYIILVLETINKALDKSNGKTVFDEDEHVYDEDDDEDVEVFYEETTDETKMKVRFFKDNRTDKNIIKIQQINSFALHVLSAIVSHLILSLILEPNEAYTPFAPIEVGDSETSIQNLIKKINHCKSYYYSNACREVTKPNVEKLKTWNKSQYVYGESQEQNLKSSTTDEKYIDTQKKLDEIDTSSSSGRDAESNSSSAAGGGAAKSNSMAFDLHRYAKSNSSSAAGGGGAESNGMTIDNSAGNEEMIPPLFGDMNELMKSGLSESDKKEINELIKFELIKLDTAKITTGKRGLDEETTSNKSQRKMGGRKSKKHKRKNMKKQSRRNKKYTR